MRQFSKDQEAVILRNKDTVYRLARAGTKNPHDADDVFQEVFLRYLKKKPQFESEEHEKNWFIRVTVNCTHSAMTTFWRRRVEPLEDELTEDFDDEPVDAEDLKAALGQLDRRHRIVLHLFYYEDLPVKDVAQALSVTEENARMLLTRARRALKEMLEKENAK